MLDYESQEVGQERYASANRQLLEVSEHLLTRIKHGFVVTKGELETIDELIGLIRLVNHTAARTNNLRKSIYTEVLDFAERVLPD